MDAIFGKRKLCRDANAASLDRVAESITDRQTKHIVDGVFVGNDRRSKKQRNEEALHTVLSVGSTTEQPLADSAVKEAYLQACRAVNAREERNKVVTGLDSALLVLQDLKDHVENTDIEWSDETKGELPPGRDPDSHGDTAPVEAVIDAVGRALKMIIYNDDTHAMLGRGA